MSILDRFSADQLDELEMLLEERKTSESRKKVDYTRMTDHERWEINKTRDPQTHYLQHVEYPKTIYTMKDGHPFWVTVQDSKAEARIRAEYPGEWANSPLAFGIETAPSNGSGIMPQQMMINPVEKKDWEDKGMKPEAFGQAAAAATEKRGPGRPRKTA